MSARWTVSHCESGILRKNEFREKKEELFVFGYSCKLFRDDERAQHIDQGKHLIPWMGDETLKIDRYDARGALHDTSAFEAPPGGFDWRVELTRTEQDVEQLCDEERYRALHTNEDEEEMYKEEELKRLHAAGYGQVGFNYETPAEAAPPPSSEPDEAFVPTPAFVDMLPTDVTLPETLKQNAIIEKTAKFIASQGVQMEILIKAKQRDNPQFKFLNRESELHPYYTALIALVKAGKWPEKKAEVVQEKQKETEEYLHPSLASTVIELAPSIPSIQYKPSADCDYRLLVSRMRGEEPPAAGDDPPPPGDDPPPPGEDPPPGTRPLPPRPTAEISRAPVMYNTAQAPEPPAPPIQSQTTQAYQQYAAYYHQYMAHAQAQAQSQVQPQVNINNSPTLKSTGLSLMKNYNTDSDTDESDFDDSSSTDSKDKPTILIPPDDVQLVIDKMAAYVARNGDEFADIVRAKNDPRFTFLDPANDYHPYYKRLMQTKRGIDLNGKDKSKKSSVPVSFSIKKLKEPDPILPKPALPYETSSDDDSEKQADQLAAQPDPLPSKPEEPIQNPPHIVNILPPVVVYKMEGQLTHNLPTVKAIETIQPMPIPTIEVKQVKEIKEVVPPPPPVIYEKLPEVSRREEKKEAIENREVIRQEVIKSPHRSKRKHTERKKEYWSKSQRRERQSDSVKRNADREKRRERDNDRDKKRKNRDLENEIISLEDNSDDLIDLTGDHSDTKVEGSPSAERAKQVERRRRAAEFLQRVGVDPAAALPTTSLASAMVDTLESLRKKKAEEEEKRRRREKRRRERREYEEESDRHKKKRRKGRSSDENDASDYEGTKKKKRKKDKKHSSKNKKKRRREIEEELPNIDLVNTLKELRSASPTKELGLDLDIPRLEMSEEDGELGGKRRKDREYSEGEWSSDSEADSLSTTSKNN